MDIKTTEQGFLIHADDWNKNVAEILAERNNILLTDAHWEIIYFIRDYYQQYKHLPNARVFTKAIAKTLGEEKGNSRYLHSLFENPLKQSCLIAGLPKPPSCL
ncbi:Sulfurtransferase TusE [Patescibacteria group bacterium]|nr:Sulfurtransferase TusE [Patescibacteria group bacterium]